MKLSLLPVLLLVAFIATGRAQTGDNTTPAPTMPAPTTLDTATGDQTPAPGSTVIQSDELHMDQVTHVAVFTGNVLVTGTNFTMKCQEMTVNFDKAGKVDTIVSKGDVEVIQPGRVTHSGQAIYYHDEDKFDLTDQPVIVDNGKKISAPEIIIYRTRQSLFTKGKSTVVLPEGSGLSSPTNPAATPATTDGTTDQK